MSNMRGTGEIGLVKAFILAICLATAARAGMAYLPLTGPAPMRVLANKSPKALPPVTLPAANPNLETNGIQNIAANIFADTNHAANVKTAAEIEAGLPPIVMSANSVLDQAFGTPILSLVTPDLMGITPQMLAAYFHPVGINSNNPTAIIPLRIGFVPPLAAPQKSSTAEYIVK